MAALTTDKITRNMAIWRAEVAIRRATRMSAICTRV